MLHFPFLPLMPSSPFGLLGKPTEAVGKRGRRIYLTNQALYPRTNRHSYLGDYIYLFSWCKSKSSINPWTCVSSTTEDVSWCTQYLTAGERHLVFQGNWPILKVISAQRMKKSSCGLLLFCRQKTGKGCARAFHTLVPQVILQFHLSPWSPSTLH